MKYNELMSARINDLFSDDELYELISLVDRELSEMKRCVYEDFNVRKAVDERIKSLEFLREDLRLMAAFLQTRCFCDVGIRRKRMIEDKSK